LFALLNATTHGRFTLSNLIALQFLQKRQVGVSLYVARPFT